MSTSRERTLRRVPDTETRLVFRTIHGYRRAFRIAGSGPAILLVHGIGDSSATWGDLIPHLAKTHTVIAPDLLGHGRSDKPRADYSVAAYANGMRDLLSVLDIERATVIGHSLGGAVAMQFAYQYPQMVDRLVLVATSGITGDVHPLLRVLSAPMVNSSLRLMRLPGAKTAVKVAGNAIGQLHAVDMDPKALLRETPDVLSIIGELPDRTSYLAFLNTLRAVVDWRGQSITLLDRCYLNEDLPVQIIWGAKDSVFPVSHAHFAHAAMPGSRIAVFDRAGHYPFHDDPIRFLRVIEEFLDTTTTTAHDAEAWRTMLVSGSGTHPVSTAPAVRLAVLDAIGGGERSAT
ncbi:alpha/beta fold hydrolase [Antrihabitans cavernicola]|uniref:Alpha/beta hydrolase n=1 Tax=Antrihabitans cavernicola TaxID=2495913 RepID=A0A5A7SF99_9NOCA|nr:alpha/beta hydrolase [Spelaeibacter cavernicola]KAA0023367.1 alpha/beta hydrolase [Spelaeibacter cavernicola]